ncbi:hypothetical protein MAR_017710 [Mya arenaria]|uniref:Uncharacterized protein n=1 Tax=Mya arenaria TaxID=6604 RepID=A0ABY7EG01_MYAAR|nr:hypothetical protein MAR_017710 [Mya arenaria]
MLLSSTQDATSSAYLESLKSYNSTVGNTASESNKEDTDDYVLTFCAKLGVSMDKCDIDRSHRTGKQNKGPRDIMVKFATYRALERLYKSRALAKDKGYKNIFVNEDLTRERSRLLFLARQQVKSKPQTGLAQRTGESCRENASVDG